MRALVCAGALCGAIVAVVPAAARTGANAGSTVFVTTGVSHWASGDVFVVDGSGPRRNVTRTPGESERDPDWSPDGSELAFARGRAATSDVYVRDAGGAERRLTTTPEREERPVWSPDGTLHAFVRVVEGRPRLWVTRRDGSGQRPLSEPTYELLTVSWSHDGKRIAFVAGRDVRVVDVARGGEKQVTTQGGAVVAASWQPDGRIAFVKEGAGQSWRVMTVAPETGVVRDERNPCGTEYSDFPTWSSDRRHVFCGLHGRFGRIVTATGREVRRPVLAPRNEGTIPPGRRTASHRLG